MAKEKPSISDFTLLGSIGRGSFGRVEIARANETSKEYAVKIVQKSLLSQEGKKFQAMRERDLLASCKHHPGIVSLHYSFHDESCLYFVMEYCPKEDLNKLIERYARNFPYELARIYAAQLVNILDFLRSKEIVHRDIKPHNILISSTNQLRLSDFGSAKVYNEEARERSNTYVGTANYVSPEMLEEKPVSYSADLWALGCIIYQMLVGKPPFAASTDAKIFEKIKSGIVDTPEILPPFAQDLIQSLLLMEPEMRIGAQNMEDLKQHIFFHGLDIDNIFEEPVPDLSAFIAPSKKAPNVILEGIVKKKAGWIYKKRILKITEEPKISYYEPTRNEHRGNIAISSKLYAEVKGRVEFHVITPKRTYFFKDLEETPEKWVEAVNQLVKRVYSKN